MKIQELIPQLLSSGAEKQIPRGVDKIVFLELHQELFSELRTITTSK